MFFFENKDSHCCLDISLFVLQMLLCMLHKSERKPFVCLVSQQKYKRLSKLTYFGDNTY